MPETRFIHARAAFPPSPPGTLGQPGGVAVKEPAHLLATIVAVAALGTASLQAREVTIEERIRAQENLQRVHYSNQLGVSRPFEEAIPRDVLERQVRTYLKQSVALETRWKTPVTAEMLHQEIERMAGSTRMPERLRQLFAALGDDPLLVQECLARPALVDRLSRNFFAYDDSIHGAARRKAEHLRSDLSQGRIDPRSDHPARTVTEFVRTQDGSKDETGGRGQPPRLPLSSREFDELADRLPKGVGEIGPLVEEREGFLVRVLLDKSEDLLRIATFTVPKVLWDEWWDSVRDRLDEASLRAAIPASQLLPSPRADSSSGFSSATCLQDDTWESVSLLKAPEARATHAGLWTGSLMIVWGGVNSSTYLSTGARYDPATDTWTPMSTINAPARSATAVWAGSRMIVWGFYDGTSSNSGARYDPISDTWTPTSTVGAPAGRSSVTSVWTGGRMIVWGGYNGAYLDTGGVYDPEADTWTLTSLVGAPTGRAGHGAVWTGKEMVVWAGYGPSYVATGGRYDPVTNTWTATSTTGAPSARTGHTSIWTGSEMVVWGGGPGTSLNTGGRYNPSTDSWTPTSTVGSPNPTTAHTAVWTGSRMIVWGGYSPFDPPPGGRYDPATDSWTPVSTTSAPTGRYQHSAVWTGTRMIVWGGRAVGNPVDTGGRYDPVSNTWTPTSLSNAPEPRYRHTSVWTGSVMIVWGGTTGGGGIRTGGRYDPATDVWSPTTILGPPTAATARQAHTAVWAGGSMVVWGGYAVFGSPLGTGRRYNPMTDTWATLTTLDAPSPRYGHTAISTGAQMIVWGGDGGTDGIQNSGGRYDPVANTWSPVSLLDAPAPRYWHTAVWSGSRMIVWGGTDASQVLSTGGLYDPATDTWASVSTINAPSSRYGHTGVWAGSRMVIWGGNELINATSESPLDTGGRYDPVTDEWSPTSTSSAPAARYWHSAVSTGGVMVVWGGLVQSGEAVNSGGRYDPGTDLWTSTSSAGAPVPRVYHTAVWTGSFMFVWGGTAPLYSAFETGGRYALGHSVDDDGDGFSECGGDCNDADAGIRPGAIEVCDGLDNDCSGVVDDVAIPSGTPLLSVDATPAGDTLLSWSPVGGATSYDSARGDLTILVSSGGDFSAATRACLLNNFAGVSYEVADMPSAGTGFWYLIRAVNCGGPGTYDSDGSGQVGRRDTGLTACP
jgi:N-acetylneuraminic acid mutarotase